MKPYYQRGPVRLYHGDCLEWLPTLHAGSVACVVTDPPYGIDCTKTGCESAGRKGFTYGGDFAQKGGAEIAGDKEVDPRWLQEAFRLVRDNGACWSFSRWDVDARWQQEIEAAGFVPKNRIIWVKANHGSGDLDGAFGYQHETIWRSVKGRSLLRVARCGDVWRDQWTECVRHGKVHPFEKPVDLLQRCVESDTDAGDTVVDPFSGSGSTAIACIRAGRRFIGCELEEKYCDIAARRCDRELDQGRLFATTSAVVETQNALFAEASA